MTIGGAGAFGTDGHACPDCDPVFTVLAAVTFAAFQRSFAPAAPDTSRAIKADRANRAFFICTNYNNSMRNWHTSFVHMRCSPYAPGQRDGARMRLNEMLPRFAKTNKIGPPRRYAAVAGGFGRGSANMLRVGLNAGFTGWQYLQGPIALYEAGEASRGHKLSTFVGASPHGLHNRVFE